MRLLARTYITLAFVPFAFTVKMLALNGYLWVSLLIIASLGTGWLLAQWNRSP